MQQTETYKLNLVEGEDTFSPLPLNENMDKVEGVFSALNGRVEALEAHKIVVGTYTGIGSPAVEIQLDATPKAVFIVPKRGLQGPVLCVEGSILVRGSDNVYLTIIENGFRIAGDMNSFQDYCYLAFL